MKSEILTLRLVLTKGDSHFATGAGAPEQHHNGYYAVDASGWPTAGSLAIDAGVVIPGITDGYVGAAPDIGCFEVGTEGWTAGADWEETPFTRVPNTEGFETGDMLEFDWQSGNWFVTSQEKSTGFYSAQSNTISADGRAFLTVTLDCQPGVITFHRKVSSRTGFDYLRFFINGVGKAEWSGELDWEEVSYPVSGGKTTFDWTYTKDDSASAGEDTAWVDNIEFPIR